MSTEYKQPLACPNTVADLCAIKTNFQNPLDNFEARFAAKAKRVFLSSAAKHHVRLNFSASVHEYSQEKNPCFLHMPVY